VGALDSVLDLRKIRGLQPVDTERSESVAPHDTLLVEAVVSARSSLVGRTVKESNFRAKYNSAIWAAHRHGEQLKGKIGDIKLRPGDTLLLAGAPQRGERPQEQPGLLPGLAVEPAWRVR